jgi:hypothetical protein
MKPFARLIRYRCTNPEHQRPTETLSDTMTIHEQSWAFCPYNVRVADHFWTIANPEAPVLVREPADLPALG